MVLALAALASAFAGPATMPDIEGGLLLGYQGNNPFARRTFGGADISVAMSRRTRLVISSAFAPDRGRDDLKSLVYVLLDRASASQQTGTLTTPGGGTVQLSPFTQPLDKITLRGAMLLAWAPWDGGIHLRDGVLETRLSALMGVESLQLANYTATYCDGEADDTCVDSKGTEWRLGPSAGVELTVFPTAWLALGFDVRTTVYVDEKPQYDPDVPVTQTRLYSPVFTNARVGVRF